MRSLKLALEASAFIALSVATTFAGPKAPTPTTHGSPKTTTVSPAPHSTTKTTTTTSAGAHTAPTLNPIAAKISSHTQLASRVRTLMPSGMTLNDASRGFKNQGQFIAALHVSKNLGIPFADLKTAMTGIRPMTGGTTGTTTTMSLGQAIHTLRPSADATACATRAEHQAATDLKITTTTTTTTTTTVKAS